MLDPIEMIELEDNIPVPLRKGGRQAAYPFREMAVGQSFFTTNPQVNAAYWSRMTRNSFVTRKTIQNGIPGIRVWRVA